MKREEALELLKLGSITKEEFLILTDTETSSKSVNISNQGYNESTNLYITWQGMWMLIDAKVSIYIDSEFKFEGSFKEGFNFPISISKESFNVEIRLGSMKTTKFTIKELALSKNYNINLQYNSFWGKFSKDIKIIRL